MRIAENHVENLISDTKLPTGAKAIACIVDDKAAPLGATLIQHPTGVYSIWLGNISRSCDQREARKIHEETILLHAPSASQSEVSKTGK